MVMGGGISSSIAEVRADRIAAHGKLGQGRNKEAATQILHLSPVVPRDHSAWVLGRFSATACLNSL